MADNIEIHGAVSGKIRARKIQLAKTAKVIGEIWHEVLSIESGAYIEGQLKRAKKGAEEREIAQLFKVKAAPVADQCQRRSKSTPLAGVKMHHLMRFSPPGQPWAGLSGFGGFPPFLALVETVAVAVHLQDMNVVCEPVQQRPSQALGTEHLGPLIER